MKLDALVEIGNTIAADEFADEWDKYYTASQLDGIQAVVAIRLVEQEQGDGSYAFKFDESYLREVEDSAAMAHRYAYAHNKRTDRSLSQKTVSMPKKDTRNVLGWPDRDELGDMRDDPFIVALRETFAAEGDAIECDVMQHFATDEDEDENGDAAADQEGGIEPTSSAPVLITVEFVAADGTTRWPSEIPAIREAIKQYSTTKFASSSYATDSTGVATCLACGEQDDVFGCGLEFDDLYTLLKQGDYGIETHNASESWRFRPLCIDCLTAIETATDRFVDAQQYRVAGVKCRVIPYALPVEGGREQLRTLIRAAREDIIGTERYDPESEQSVRPLQRAWREYRTDLALDLADDALRLAIIHYRKDQSRAYPLGWVDGVSVPHVVRIEETASSVTDRPAYAAAIRPGPDPETVPPDKRIYVAPTERQIWTGMWAHNVLARESSKSGTDPAPGDKPVWVELTQAMLAGESMAAEPVIAALVEEIHARRQDDIDYESDVDDPYYHPPFDGRHVARAYVLLETLAELGVCRFTTAADDVSEVEAPDERGELDPDRGEISVTDAILTPPSTTPTAIETTDTDLTDLIMTPHRETDRDLAPDGGVPADDASDPDPEAQETIDARAEQAGLRFGSLGAAVDAFIDEHATIRASPGRTAAFAMGVMASALSGWQQDRDLNRTLLSNVRLDTVTVDDLPAMKAKIWDKSTIYHAQNGKPGTPWSDLHAMVDRALLDGESSGWNASRDDVKTFFVMGTVAGPRLRRLVERENGDQEESDDQADQANQETDADADEQAPDREQSTLY